MLDLLAVLHDFRSSALADDPIAALDQLRERHAGATVVVGQSVVLGHAQRMKPF